MLNVVKRCPDDVLLTLIVKRYSSQRILYIYTNWRFKMFCVDKNESNEIFKFRTMNVQKVFQSNKARAVLQILAGTITLIPHCIQRTLKYQMQHIAFCKMYERIMR